MKEIQSAGFFSKLPHLENLSYRGELASKIQFFSFLSGQLAVSRLIRKEEALAWKSFEEMLGYALKQAAAKLRGFYGFEVLALDLHEKTGSFQAANFSELVINHARQLAVGEKKLVRYTSLFGLLSKRVEETWGKMDVKTCVEVYAADPPRPDLLAKRMLREAGKTGSVSEKELILAVHDLSVKPLFRDSELSGLEKILASAAGQERRIKMYLLDYQGVLTLASSLATP